MPTSITSRPQADIQPSVPCYYVPAFNPIQYTLQRADYAVSSIEQNGSNAELVLSLSEGDVSAGFSIGDNIFFSSSLYTNSTASVLAVSWTGTQTKVQISEPYTGIDDTGDYIINNLTKFPAFAVEIDVWADGAKRGTFKASASSTGEIKADVSAFVRTAMTGGTLNPYTADTFADTGAVAPFHIVYREINGGTPTAVSDSGNTRFAVWASRQIGDDSGNNMRDYVGITGTLNLDALPKFLTMFESPTYYEGYPFTLDYIIQDNGLDFDFNRWENSGSISQTSITPGFTAINRLSLMGGYTGDSVQVKIVGDDTGNTLPQAQNVSIESDTVVLQEGTVLTGDYDYFDADNDLEQGSVLEFLRADDASGTGAFVVSTGSLTYNIPSGQTSKYYAFRVTPGAATGSTPGTAVTTAWIGPVLQIAATVTHTKQSDFAISIEGGNGTIEWGDDSTQSFDATGGAVNYQKTYASGGSKIVRIYCDPTQITALSAFAMEVTDADLSRLSFLSDLNLANNSLDSLALGAGFQTWTSFYLQTTTPGALSSLDLSGYIALGGEFRVDGNSNLSSITWPASTSNQFSTLFDLSLTAISTLDLSWADFATGCDIEALNCTSLTSVGTLPTPTGVIRNLEIKFSANLTGNIDLSPLDGKISGNIDFRDCDITGITLPIASTGSIILQNNRISTLDWSRPTLITGQVWYHNQTAGILTSVTMPSSTGTITLLSAHSNPNQGYIDLTGFTFSSAAQIYIHANGWNAAIVNQVLVELDSTLGTATLGGANLIWINGTNAAPDGTSGGYDGLTAVSNLTARNWNVSSN